MTAPEPRQPASWTRTSPAPPEARRSAHSRSCAYDCPCWDGRIAAVEYDRDHPDLRGDWT